MSLEKKILSRELQQYLYESGKTISTAESCTAGQIAEAIIASPGASAYFKGGIVAYTDEIKTKVLGVNADTLEAYTAVSEAVAKEMAEGACRVLNTDFAISITGIAGPTGGTAEIPVRTIWIGYGEKNDIKTYMLSEDDGRDINLSRATSKALRLMIEYLSEKIKKPAEDEL